MSVGTINVEVTPRTIIEISAFVSPHRNSYDGAFVAGAPANMPLSVE